MEIWRTLLVCYIASIFEYYHISFVLQAIDLLSAQGGQVSLWLGLSVLTLFEMVELVWDLIVSVIAAGSRKSRGARETGNRKLESVGTGKKPPTTETTND